MKKIVIVLALVVALIGVCVVQQSVKAPAVPVGAVTEVMTADVPVSTDAVFEVADEIPASPAVPVVGDLDEALAPATADVPVPAVVPAAPVVAPVETVVPAAVDCTGDKCPPKPTATIVETKPAVVVQ